MYKPVEVKAKENYTIWVRYEDGSNGEVDLSHLAGKGVFRAWGDDVDFNEVYIDQESGAIAWNEELELCPDSIYYKINRLDPEEQMMKEMSFSWKGSLKELKNHYTSVELQHRVDQLR